jgi:hypothetical protein
MMGFSLPSGVVNTNSAYFYAGATNALGALVKELSDQTLIVLDYSQVTPPIALTSYSFTADVTSNPALIVSYPQLNATGTVLTFLVSGGIAGQQYNLTIVGNNQLGTRNDVLTVNIPSSQGECQSINPVPAIYTQVPLGSQGYVNTGVRYFWGRTPPANPNVLDQWYDPTDNSLSEWATDGTEFFWELITASNLVQEARSDGIIYGRFNANWVAEPIQFDAPVNFLLYSRSNKGWVPNVIQSDAPNDGHLYARQFNTWTLLPQQPILSDAPIDGNLYGRLNAGWTIVTPPVISVDAPADGNSYMRNNHGWSSGGTLTGSLTVVGNVVIDGTLSVQQPSFFTGNITAYGSIALSNDPISPGQAANKHYVDNAIIAAFNSNGSPFLQLAGGTMAGAIELAADPVNPLEPVTLKYFQAHAPGGLTDANADGTTYGRLNHTWVNVLALTGGTLTGALILAGAPSVANGAANKGYVDSAITASVPQPSGSPPPMDGTAATGVSSAYARADHVHPSDASKYNASNPSGYQTAAQVSAALGNYYPTSNPAGYQTAAQVSAALTPYALISSVPVGASALPLMDGGATVGAGVKWAREDHVHPTDTTRLALAGGTMTGALVLNADPAALLGAATKQYVDNAVIDCGVF